jgi:antitoxin VapB
MSLNIKSDETEQLARGLARLTGESITGAITVALQERLARLRGRQADEVSGRKDQLRAISADAAARWKPEYREVDHADLLYDEAGLPR